MKRIQIRNYQKVNLKKVLKILEKVVSNLFLGNNLTWTNKFY